MHHFVVLVGRALVVGCGDGPVVGQGTADEEERQLCSDEAECDIDGDIVNPTSLLESLAGDDVSGCTGAR